MSVRHETFRHWSDGMSLQTITSDYLRAPTARRLRTPRGLALGLILNCGLLLGGVLVAGEPDANSTALVDAPKSEAIQDEIQRIEHDMSLEPTVRQRLVDTYQQTLAELELAAQVEARIERSQADCESIPQELTRFRADLNPQAAEPELAVPADASLETLEQRSSAADADLIAAQRELAKWDDEPRRRTDWRLNEYPKLKSSATSEQGALEQELRDLDSVPSPTDGPDLMFAQATRQLLHARLARVAQQLASYEQEQHEYEASVELLAARSESAARRASAAERRVEQWRALVSDRRRLEADQQAQLARAAAINARSEVRSLAETIARLAERRRGQQGWPARIERAVADLSTSRQQAHQLREEFERVRQKIVRAGLTSATGLQLRKQLAGMPDLGWHRRRIRARQEELADVQLALLEIEDQHDRLQDLDQAVNQYLTQSVPDLASADRAGVEQAVRGLLVDQKALIADELADANKFFYHLVDLDDSEQSLVRDCEEYAEFVRERVLWIKSCSRLGTADPRLAQQGLEWLCSRQNWSGVASSAMSDLARNTPVVMLLMLAATLGLCCIPRLRTRVSLIGEQATHDYVASMAPTWEALWRTLLLSLAYPSLLWLIGWRLEAAPEATEFAKSVGEALRASASVLLICELMRQLCRKRGLAEAHFGGSPGRLRSVRRSLRWLIILGLPLVGLCSVAEGGGHATLGDPSRAALGRACFMVGMALLSFFAWKALRWVPADAPPTNSNAAGLFRKLRPAIQVTALVAPWVLVFIAALGYFETALRLAWRAQATLWLSVGLLLARALIERWVLTARRRVAIAQARARRASLTVASGAAAPQRIAEPEVDLANVNRQTSSLIRSGFAMAMLVGSWWIWVDDLPALSYLDQWKLWSYSASVLPIAADDGAAQGTGVPNEAGWITAGDVLLGGVVLLMTMIGVKNLPGLVEIGLLQHLPLDHGGRYAITTLSRYAITLIGIIVGCRAVGIGWANVQWLAAAISVGLGFGMQEIFANFVSGLILLFERPMRPGDTVTVSGVTGTVNRIRIRSTTITDWDRKELIVPNREFITGPLVNWTLTDTVIRMVFKVGVAYGSDTALVQRLLLDVARQNPRVMQDPPPVALFNEFGESTLDFELRVHLPGLEQFSQTRHELNTAIDQTFRQAGIEIPFPQRDLHLRTSEPVPARVVRQDHAMNGAK